MLYEFATLSFHPLHGRQVTAGAEAYVIETEARGHLLGCWTTDIGTIGRMFVLRGFADAAELAAERKRALFSANPFGAAEVLTGLEMDSYAPFPFLPPVVPGKYGKVYEFRTYHLKPGGLTPTIAAWEAAMPERAKLSPLVINMYALDGAPRITHIWPYASLDARAAIRADSYAQGIWPPKNAPEQFYHATSTIGLPTAASPLA
ncbi:MAG TPA: NIPSNAP family protein [Bradyrhizobium sp.]